MDVVKINSNHRVITFGPYTKGNHKYKTVVHEKGNDRLVVSTRYKDDVRCEQCKTYSKGYNYVKQIIVEFVNGIRSKVQRTR